MLRTENPAVGVGKTKPSPGAARCNSPGLKLSFLQSALQGPFLGVSWFFRFQGQAIAAKLIRIITNLFWHNCIKQFARIAIRPLAVTPCPAVTFYISSAYSYYYSISPLLWRRAS
jgi:hypothetical protein